MIMLAGSLPPPTNNAGMSKDLAGASFTEQIPLI